MESMQGAVTGTRVRDNLVVTLPTDLSGDTLAQVRDVTLHQVHNDRPSAVILECSAVSYMDTHEFDELRAISDVVAVLGARTCFAGLRPGIVKHLVLSDVNLDGVRAFLGLNEALDHLARETRHGEHD